MHLSKRGVENIRRGLKRSWEPGGSHDRRFRAPGKADADTMRRRALADRKGEPYATITMKRQRFTILWSALGRSDQVDIFWNNRKQITCRTSLVLRRIEELSA